LISKINKAVLKWKQKAWFWSRFSTQ
jgi:hypothetical protein